MRQTKSLKTLNMGKGTLLDLVQLEDAKEEYAAILTFDGEEGSEPFHIPPHWHKVTLLGIYQAFRIWLT
ncbi:hypothetical protein FDECE_6182 [Fusarium decemcellulare]|nr:hypothetical protein FDECE_6182 [Fusarium decemcellulare]